MLWANAPFGNPSSGWPRYGRKARELVEAARGKLQIRLRRAPRKSFLHPAHGVHQSWRCSELRGFYQSEGKHIVSSRTEHKAVLDTLQQLEREDSKSTYLKPELPGSFITRANCGGVPKRHQY